MKSVTVDELEELVRTRPCRGSAPPRRYSDILARFPRMRGEVLAWFESALRDETRKWVAATLLAGRREAVAPLVRPLLLAAIREPDPSFNRAFVRPLLLAGLSFDPTLLDDSVTALAPAAIEVLRVDPDPYIRERLAVQLDESKLFPALLPPKGER